MKSIFALAGFVTLLAQSVVFGQGADMIIKQHAKELNNQNNVRQGVAPPTQPQPKPATVAQPAPALSPWYTKLQTDLAAIKADGQATAAQKQALTDDLMGLAQSSKPTQAAASKLAGDISAALATKQLDSAGRARLVQELDAILNPAKYPQAKIPAIIDDIQAIFQVNGLDRKRAAEIGDGVKALTAKQ